MLDYRYSIPALTFSPQQSLRKVIMMLGCIHCQQQDSNPALVLVLLWLKPVIFEKS
jgi:hypothetical protein